MKNSIKKTIALIMTLVMVLTLAPVVSLAVNDSEILSGGDEITSGGTYYINAETTGVIHINTIDPVILAGDGLSFETLDSSEVVAAHNLSFVCDVPGVQIYFHDIAIIEPATGLDVFDFTGEGNVVYLSGRNLVEINSNAQYRCAFHIADDANENGETDCLAFVNEDDGNPGVLYCYKREQGAGIGSHGSGEVSGEVYFGCTKEGIEQDNGPVLFMKVSKQGAGIGNGANTSAAPGNIKFYSGIYNMIAVARGAMIGGSAGSDSADAGNVYIYPNASLRVNVDFTGAAIGGGGYASGNDKGGGNCYFFGGSVCVFEDYNSSSNNVNGSGVLGYSDAMITATKLNSEDAQESVYWCPVDMRMVSSDYADIRTTWRGDDAEYYMITLDGESVFNGFGHEYYYINETYYKTEQQAITTTYSNWKLLSENDEENPYINLFLPDLDDGQTHILSINGENFEISFNHSTTFTHYDSATGQMVTLDTADGAEKASYESWTEHTFTVELPETTVTGGDTISTGGRYVLSDETDGVVTVATSDSVAINGSGTVYDNLSIAAAADTTADITLKNVKLTGDGTLLSLTGDTTLTLSGDSTLVGTGTTAGAPTVLVADGCKLTVDSANSASGIRSAAYTLLVEANAENAAVKIGGTGTLEQKGGTLQLVKKGAGSAALDVSEGAVIFSGGEFCGATNDACPAILADTMDVSVYGSVSAYSVGNTFAIHAGAYNITGGSIKAVGSSGADAAAIDGIYDGEDAGTATGYGVYKLDVTTLNHNAVTFSVWDGGATVSDNRFYYGAGHNYESANGDALTHVQRDLLSDGVVTNACDRYLYLWFDVTGTHSITLNDDPQGEIYWNSDATEFVTSMPTYNVSVQSVEGAAISVDKATARAGETVTATLSYDNVHYTLNSSGFRYMYFMGTSQHTSTLASAAGTYTFVMPSYDVTVYAEVTPNTYNVTNILGNLTSNGGRSAVYNQNYSATLTPKADLFLPDSISVSVGGTTLEVGSGYSYNAATGILTINGTVITGNIVITATAAEGSDAPPTTVVDGTVYYQLDSVEDLMWFNQRTSAGTVYNALLTADIDATGSNWTPIGGNNAFRGIFDGAGHTVTFEYISDEENLYGIGFFSNIVFGTVKNLILNGTVNCSAESSCVIAGLTGDSESLTIENCVINVDVTGGDMVAEIVGYPCGSLNITNTVIAGSVKCSSAGGSYGLLVGMCDANIIATNCYYLDGACPYMYENNTAAVNGFAPFYLGDVNSDGVIDASDAGTLLLAGAEMLVFTNLQNCEADISGDNLSAKAALILRYTVGLVNALS